MRSKRIEDVENYIFEMKTVTLDQLCEKFSVSKNTIRRDIKEITSKGSIKKIYGGVTAQTEKDLVSFDERNIKNLDIKQRIAQKAASLVEDGDVIFIDSGTTTRHMIDALKNRRGLTLLTNNIDVILRALPYENITVISLSGTLNRKTLSFTGTSAAQVLSTYNISKSFMASTGISLEGGATNSSPLEYDIKRAAVDRSQKVYLLADHFKFGVISLMTYCTLDKINLLVTDTLPGEDMLRYFQERGIGVLLTDGGAP